MIDFGMRYCTDIHSVNIIGLSNIVIETFFLIKIPINCLCIILQKRIEYINIDS